MPVHNGSCLNEEYTKMIQTIYSHLEEARTFYNELPESIRRSSNELCNHTETLGLILTKGVAAAEELKKDYGIE